MARIVPYLNFTGNCREAMSFYKECLGGELNLLEFAGTDAEKMVRKEELHRIMHSSLSGGKIELFACDVPEKEMKGYVDGSNITLSLNCDSEAEIRTIFNKLSKGGKIGMPLDKPFWGGLYGQF